MPVPSRAASCGSSGQGDGVAVLLEATGAVFLFVSWFSLFSFLGLVFLTKYSLPRMFLCAGNVMLRLVGAVGLGQEPGVVSAVEDVDDILISVPLICVAHAGAATRDGLSVFLLQGQDSAARTEGVGPDISYMPPLPWYSRTMLSMSIALQLPPPPRSCS